ncbi:Hypothetical_protein [Hexamita inflata]|uniref:Hypothetical_protein n=1 Tax=Hexamita inflata TaxID=28002 RepID=A0AA86PDI1_9EUKA|nr:Hypothetical protein HINF_LOCUS24709 [Hexamita inflata]
MMRMNIYQILQKTQPPPDPLQNADNEDRYSVDMFQVLQKKKQAPRTNASTIHYPEVDMEVIKLKKLLHQQGQDVQQLQSKIDYCEVCSSVALTNITKMNAFDEKMLGFLRKKSKTLKTK